MPPRIVQPALLFPDLPDASERFEPLPHAPHHYVPILQNRAGELQALERARPETWARMTPMIVAVGPRDRRKRLTSTQIAGWAKRLSVAVEGHPFFLDVMRLDPLQDLGDGRLALSYLYERARSRGLQFVPVLPLAAGPALLRLVRDSAQVDRRGVGLRLNLSETALPAGTTLAGLLTACRSALGLDALGVDVVLDLGWLSPDATISAADMCDVIDEVSSVGIWRNIVLVATSMPETLSAISEGSLGGLRRAEWELWTEVTGPSYGRQASFGDYGIQHPRPPADSGPGMRANIRYTTETRTVIARGEGSVTQGGGAQYPELCRMITGLDDFATRDYSWGDEVIETCATGGDWSASQALWRGAGTSHHLRVVGEQLAALEGT